MRYSPARFFWPSLPKPKRKMRKPIHVRGGDKRISKPLRREAAR